MEPGTDVAAGRIRLAGHVAAPLTRAAGGGRAGSLARAAVGDPRLVRPDPYPRLGVVWRTDARTRTRRFLPFDLARVLRGGADLPLAEGDEVVLLGQADVLWLSSPGVQGALRGDAGAAEAAQPQALLPSAGAAARRRRPAPAPSPAPGLPRRRPGRTARPCPPWPSRRRPRAGASPMRGAAAFPISAGSPARPSSSNTRCCCPSCSTRRCC